MFSKLLAWAEKNERHIGAVLFVCGFATDLATFTLLDTSAVNKVFIGYLAIGLISAVGSHYLHAHQKESGPMWRKILTVGFPFLVQYATGSLFSGFLILYTESSVLSVSWPFLLVLALVFLANEFFRKYKEQLTFQVGLLFFALYAYSIFILPLLLGTIGPKIFLFSTAISIGALILFLAALAGVGWRRLTESLLEISIVTISVVVLVVGSYFLNLLPPLPLALKDSGIYHTLTHTGDGYEGTRENVPAWYTFSRAVVHVTPHESLYAFSAVYAPIQFSTGVMHLWEYFDPTTKKWTVKSTIAFPLSGGRKEGYRGYSEVSDLAPGTWRVSVETPEGQIIGRIHFEVEAADTPPVLHTESH